MYCPVSVPLFVLSSEISGNASTRQYLTKIYLNIPNLGNKVKLSPTLELSAVGSQGNFLFPSAHEAKAYCFTFFLSKAQSIRFGDFINILRLLVLALKSALRFVSCSYYFINSCIAIAISMKIIKDDSIPSI